MGALAVVPEPFGHRSPGRAVPDARAGQRVRDLVQQDLVDFVVFVPTRKVARHRDAVPIEAAEARAGLGVVEAE
jgi:hypothetical protein